MPLTCHVCTLHSTARKWLCACNKNWVGCQIHAQIGFSCHSLSFLKSASQFSQAADTHRYTNHMPPPRGDQTPHIKRARHTRKGNACIRVPLSVQRHAPRMPTFAPHVSTESVHVGGTKRAASQQRSACRKRQPPPSSAVSAIAAVNRLREAKEHPL